MKNQLLVLLGASLLSGHVFSATEIYNIDNKHSFANFSIRHVVAKASAVFTDIKGIIRVDHAI